MGAKRQLNRDTLMRLQTFILITLGTLLSLSALNSKADTLIVIAFENNTHHITHSVKVGNALSEKQKQLKSRFQQAKLGTNAKVKTSVKGLANNTPFDIELPNIMYVYAPLKDGEGHTSAELKTGSYRVRLPYDNVDLNSLNLVIDELNGEQSTQSIIKIGSAL